MYAISYEMFTGTMQHRAASAQAALDTVELVDSSGGKVLKIAVTASGRDITIAELESLALGFMLTDEARPAVKRRRLFRPVRRS